jgi:hypothetical protein
LCSNGCTKRKNVWESLRVGREDKLEIGTKLRMHLEM